MKTVVSFGVFIFCILACSVTYFIEVEIIKWGFIDKTGEMIIEPKYADVHDSHENPAGVNVIEKTK